MGARGIKEKNGDDDDDHHHDHDMGYSNLPSSAQWS
jgi:hypothetical protein